MKMKRYFAADSRQALRELRDDQGPDAVILSNRRVKGGVEIIAALDYDEAMINSSLGNPEALSSMSSAAGTSHTSSPDNEHEYSQYPHVNDGSGISHMVQQAEE